MAFFHPWCNFLAPQVTVMQLSGESIEGTFEASDTFKDVALWIRPETRETQKDPGDPGRIDGFPGLLRNIDKRS